jgi:predicted O-methyltransferase YrrM
MNTIRTSIELGNDYQTYNAEIFGREPHALFEEAKKAANALGKGSISVAASEGRLIHFLVSSAGCRKFIEVGTLTGYSALWIASGLAAGGELFTLEKEPTHAKAAREVLGKADFNGVKISVVEGDALQTLPGLTSKGPFDGIFIDANKPGYTEYLLWAEKNLRKGGLILADNIFQRGAVWDKSHPNYGEKAASVMREFNQRLADQTRFESCILPTGDGLFAAKLR